MNTQSVFSLGDHSIPTNRPQPGTAILGRHASPGNKTLWALKPKKLLQWAAVVLGMAQALSAQGGESVVGPGRLDKIQPAGLAKPGRPNVIVFLADDLGFGDLACHGNPHVQTPQLDAFSLEATELTQFRVSPMCSPTRASLMTGRYNFRTGVYTTVKPGCEMDPGETTVAECLRGAGYKTGLFGKWHLGFRAGSGPNDQGFEETLTFNSWDGAGLLPSYNDPTLLHNGKPEKKTGYCMDIFTDAAISFMRENRDQPFFVYLPANLIHSPLQIAHEFYEDFAKLNLPEDTQKIYGMIRSVDDNFGRLRAALKELGLEENTMLIFTSDNGASVPMDRFMAGLHGLKATVYENGIRVPTFARWPAGFESPSKVTQSAAHIDLLPTILAACSVKSPEDVKLDGVSLLPVLRAPSSEWPERALFFQQTFRNKPMRGETFSVLNGRWKLVQPCGKDSGWASPKYNELCRIQGVPARKLTGPPRYELYDILADPGEAKNLALEHPDMVERMKNQYDAWFTDVAARWSAGEEKGHPGL
jgi:arylsulfatase A-like enzyme